MCKKLIFTILFICLFYNLNIEAQWIKEKCPTSNNLNAVYFISNDSGWIVGDHGTILKKTDDEWISYNQSIVENLYGIHMLDNNTGWAVGAKGTIINFNGTVWKPYLSPTNKNLLSVYFMDAENGIAVGENGTVVIFKKGVWSLSTSKTRANLHTAFFTDNDMWLAGGMECVRVPIMKMQDKGSIIQDYNDFSSATINSIFLLNDYDGWAVGSPSTLIHFDGFKWEKFFVNDRFASLKSVYFSDENNGISVGFDGTILLFSNEEWKKENSDITENLNGAAIVDNFYYAVGDNGILLKKLLIQNDSNKDLTQGISNMIKVYPNPCNEILEITLPDECENSSCQISIFNSFGQLIFKEKFNPEKSDLFYSLTTTNLNSGLYILEMKIENKTSNTKFIVQH